MSTLYDLSSALSYQANAQSFPGEDGIIFAAARKELGSLDEKVVLDFGCGTGRSSRILQDWGARHVIGVDRNPKMLEAARSFHSEKIEYHQIQDDGSFTFTGRCD